MIEDTLEETIAKASPGKLIEMLYARALSDLRNAIVMFDKESETSAKVEAVRFIIHAQMIISELNNSVNTKEKCVEDLASNLKRIYQYMQYRLTEAISKYDKAPVLEVINLLSELHDAWKVLINEKGM